MPTFFLVKKSWQPRYFFQCSQDFPCFDHSKKILHEYPFNSKAYSFGNFTSTYHRHTERIHFYFLVQLGYLFETSTKMFLLLRTNSTPLFSPTFFLFFSSLFYSTHLSSGEQPKTAFESSNSFLSMHPAWPPCFTKHKVNKQ